MFRKLVALLIFGGLAKICGALWVVIQLLTFWYSHINGREDSDDELVDTGAVQKKEEKTCIESDS